MRICSLQASAKIEISRGRSSFLLGQWQLTSFAVEAMRTGPGGSLEYKRFLCGEEEPYFQMRLADEWIRGAVKPKVTATMNMDWMFTGPREEQC